MQRARVYDAQVIAFHEILDEAFPIGVPLFLGHMNQPVRSGFVGGKHGIQRGMLKMRFVFIGSPTKRLLSGMI